MKATPRHWRAIALAIGMTTFVGFAQDTSAQSAFPSKNVVIILPYTAGGSTDVIARAMAQRLGEMWGKNVIVENRPGASGMIGAEMAAKAAPDGYTLLSTTSSYPATASTRAKLPFDPAKAIVPVAMFGRAPMLLAVHPSVPARSVKELVALAKKNPGKLNYGSSGTGGNNHFSGALFAAAAGVKMVHVPYKGIANAVTALASGEIEVVISSNSALLPMIQTNRVRILGVTTLEPSPLFPKLPSIAQSGVPGYSYELWWGLFAPANISKDLMATINGAVNKVLSTPEMKKFLDNQGVQPWPLNPQQLDGLLVKEIERYRKIAQIAGITPQ
ncbi:MAG TPA: tripartite tricarboxylate transporter substrate binding protein [Burkholderiales bacterium]|nr:tripartite tricarboxylate transporter substrate binding protein [Burkholderiales bacterium]